MNVVRTKYGLLSGVEETGKYEGITLFKGVPYAKPPVGELRFADPVEPDAWEGVKVCDTYAPMAIQKGAPPGMEFEPFASDFYYMGYPEMSEDCLYLNITTGAKEAGEKRPVYMWFHGGGLSTGHSYEIEFDARTLAQKGVVVVTVGQRLNIFGYLCLPQLSAEQGGVSGNYGLKDEVRALDWVYENIAAFGGDPENITIGGQSGGTAKSGALATCPYQKGRVKRVINQSSLYWLQTYPTQDQAAASAKEYLAACGINPEATVEELRALPAEAFYAAAGGNPFAPGPMLPGSMVYDGDYVAEMKASDAMNKYAAHCDYLIGGNFGESTMHPGFVLFGKPFTDAASIYARVQEMTDGAVTAEELEAMLPIPESKFDAASRYIAGLGFTGFGGEMLNRCFGKYRTEKYPETRTYSYYFTHITPSRPEEAGTARDCHTTLAWHSSELWYTFGSLAENVPPVRPWTEVDFRLADQMTSYWANFMAKGDPNGENLPDWPASDASMSWMELGDEPKAHYGMEGKLDELLLTYTAKRGLPE